MSRNKKELISNFSEFVVSRGLGTVVDTLVLWFCEKLLFTGYWGQYLISPAISFEVATLFNFVLSYYWIWKSRIHTKNARVFWHLFWIFNLSCVAGFFVKMVFLLLFERLFRIDAVFCNLLALCISGIFNFYLSEWLVFRKKSPEPVNTVLSLDEMCTLSPLFNGGFGRLLALGIMKLFGVTKLNRLYDTIASYRGVECISQLIDRMGCNYLIGNPGRLSDLPKGSFISICNHPYGGLDGLILGEIIGGRRGDYKIMVNDILSRAKAISDVFITVTPTTVAKKAPDAVTIRGIREMVNHIGDGHALGCFPSGAVSDFKPKTWTLEDRKWQPSMIKMIKRARVPIVPVHFLDGNSGFFYFLGLVDWKIRLLRLPHEFFNKNKGTHRVVVGETITVEEQDRYEDMEEYGRMLREKVYGMPATDDYLDRNTYQRPLRYRNDDDTD